MIFINCYSINHGFYRQFLYTSKEYGLALEILNCVYIIKDCHCCILLGIYLTIIYINDTFIIKSFFSLLSLSFHFPPSFLMSHSPSLLTFLSPFLLRIQQIKEMSLESVVILLVGNKVDLTQQRVVDNEDAKEFASNLGIHYFETSAKDNTNIKESAEYLVDAITEKMSETIRNNPNFTPRGMKPREANYTEEKSSTCPC